eukprot:CAMPEP_0182573940 /NCGR_PEP_ID=MMETSP1324-20130603/20757_1 /TAXON_ID=236786 /ORGANISM="Florenciella sp., Strain RCC1587" /LENGTH=41 /DNA_ID= /DNA_START= /DNA_END= /DNA_ORIENTATION=
MPSIRLHSFDTGASGIMILMYSGKTGGDLQPATCNLGLSNL